ncbi:MAG: hypothetical protein GY835_02725, partial [bacterium]|nr:hypothetical protein [bacterium]
AILAILLVSPAPSAAADGEGAQSIKICVQADQQYQGVTDIIVGNMVAPGLNNCPFWYQPPAMPCWTWLNQGHNDDPFSLMFNYRYNGVDKTAFRKITIDPTKMGQLNPSVTVQLTSCAVGGTPANCVLAVKKQDYGSGVTVERCETIPTCQEMDCQPD